MIAYLKGKLTDLNPTTAIIECSGVGYELNISLNTYTVLQSQTEATLFVHEVIREDAHILFGFSTQEERKLFLLLTSVSGVGGSTARMILSAFNLSELCQIITSENDKVLKTVKGIGLKTAQRIIVELKDKLTDFTMGETLTNESVNAVKKVASTPIAKEAVMALSMLGFSPASSQKVVVNILETNPEITVEKVIKQALKLL